MGLKFYIGASGSGKSYRLYEDIIAQAMENPHRNYLVVVPDQFTMQTSWTWCAATPEAVS